MSDNLGRTLLSLKERLETGKQRRSELQGELRSLMRQLKEQFDVESLEDAEELLEQETNALEKLEASLKERVRLLEEAMSGDE